MLAPPLESNVELTSTTRETKQPLNSGCQHKLKRAVMGARCGVGMLFLSRKLHQGWLLPSLRRIIHTPPKSLYIFCLRRKNLNNPVKRSVLRLRSFAPLVWSLIMLTSRNKIQYSECNEVKIPESLEGKVKLSFEILAPRKKSMLPPCHITCTVYFSSYPSYAYLQKRESYVPLNLIWNIKKQAHLLLLSQKKAQKKE